MKVGLDCMHFSLQGASKIFSLLLLLLTSKAFSHEKERRRRSCIPHRWKGRVELWNLQWHDGNDDWGGGGGGGKKEKREKCPFKRSDEKEEEEKHLVQCLNTICENNKHPFTLTRKHGDFAYTNTKFEAIFFSSPIWYSLLVCVKPSFLLSPPPSSSFLQCLALLHFFAWTSRTYRLRRRRKSRSE